MSKHTHSGTHRAQATSSGRPHESAGAGPPADGASSSGSSPTHEQIAVQAYEHWEARGRGHGADRDDWYEAERQLQAGGPVPHAGAAVPGAPEEAGPSNPRHPDPGPHPHRGRGGKPRQAHATTAERSGEAGEARG